MGIFDTLFNTHKLVKRETIEVPECFAKLDKIPKDGSYCHFPDVSSQIGVNLWRPELGGCCVTLVLDNLLKETKQGKGTIYVILPEDSDIDDYVNIAPIEMMSSGVRYKGSFHHLNADVMVLDIDTNWSKSSLTVPNDPYLGYRWHKCIHEGFHSLATKDLGGELMLNFAVCGEFDLSIYFCEQGSDKLQHIFSKGFFCK